MRTMTLYANELCLPTDMHTGAPTISTATAQDLVDNYAPWAARWERVSGGIKCWESVDEHLRWREER